MQSAKFSDIKKQLQIDDDTVYYFAVDNSGNIILRKKTDDYELGQKDIGKPESDDSWQDRLDL
ncbi:MAG: hypothetical protein OQK67_01830 [Chlorobium sp.]|nr:hypothetical protein [Chlorobium sp.]MCW8820292.1 hypothetical protein [Ignavibacteriaceae bacterium]